MLAEIFNSMPDHIKLAIELVVTGTAGLSVGYFVGFKNHKRQIKSARTRDLLDSNLPLLRTHYKKVCGEPYGFDHDMYEQHIRNRANIDLRRVYGTNTELYVNYILKAAKIALHSDDPIVWNHLEEALKKEPNAQSIHDDIIIGLKDYVSALVYQASGVCYETDDYPETLGFPVIVAEKLSERVQMRLFFTTAQQSVLENLPKPEELLIEKGNGDFEHNPADRHNRHLVTKRYIADALGKNSALKDVTSIRYPKANVA